MRTEYTTSDLIPPTLSVYLQHGVNTITRKNVRNGNGDISGNIDWKSYGKKYGKRVIETEDGITSVNNGGRKVEKKKEWGNKQERGGVTRSTSVENGALV